MSELDRAFNLPRTENCNVQYKTIGIKGQVTVLALCCACGRQNCELSYIGYIPPDADAEIEI